MNMSHENCTHASTKAGRAQCRRNRNKLSDAFASVAAEFGNVQMEGVEIEPPAPVFVAENVTRDNWRDFADKPVVLFTRIDEDVEAPIAEGVKITGWGARWVNYVNDEGKTKRTAVTCLGARTVEA